MQKKLIFPFINVNLRLSASKIKFGGSHVIYFPDILVPLFWQGNMFLLG